MILNDHTYVDSKKIDTTDDECKVVVARDLEE
jgi:hypothetical protein